MWNKKSRSDDFLQRTPLRDDYWTRFPHIRSAEYYFKKYVKTTSDENILTNITNK